MSTLRQPSADGPRNPACFRWCVPRDLPYFRGHFPGVPILPGVAEINDFVLPGITAAFPDLIALRRIERLKFHCPIGPGDEIELSIEREHGTSAVRFEITRAGERCASGVLIFANDTSAALP